MFEDSYLDTFMEDRLSGGGDYWDTDDLGYFSDNEAWEDMRYELDDDCYEYDGE